MKKLLALVLALALTLSLAGCGGDSGTSGSRKEREKSTPEISVEGVNVIEDVAEFTLVRIYSGEKVLPPKPGSVYSYYEADEGETYAVIVMDVKNLGTEPEELGDLLAMELLLGSEEISALATVEAEGGSDLDRHYDVAPLETVRAHYLFEVPGDTDMTELSVRAVAGSETRKATLNMAYFADKVRLLTVGDIITDGETITATLEDVFTTTELNPPNPSSYYHRFTADSGKVYAVMKLRVKNLVGNDMDYDTIAGVRCVYDDKYNYSSFAVFEEDGGGDLSSYASVNSLKPLEENVVYYLMEIPQEAENGPLEISIYIAGEYCRYRIG